MFLLRILGLVVVGLAWGAMDSETSFLRESWGVVVMLAVAALPALSALGVGMLLRTQAVEVGPTGPLAQESSGIA